MNSDFVKSINPINDWVLFELQKQEEEIVNGIIIQRKGNAYTRHGKVLKVGPGRRNRKGVLLPMDVKPGDTVYISNLGRCEYIKNDEGRILALCPEPLIDGIVEDM
jgi:chaperonin GroES